MWRTPLLDEVISYYLVLYFALVDDGAFLSWCKEILFYDQLIANGLRKMYGALAAQGVVAGYADGLCAVGEAYSGYVVPAHLVVDDLYRCV